jgi:hypothetical protein
VAASPEVTVVVGTLHRNLGEQAGQQIQLATLRARPITVRLSN